MGTVYPLEDNEMVSKVGNPAASASAFGSASQ